MYQFGGARIAQLETGASGLVASSPLCKTEPGQASASRRRGRRSRRREASPVPATFELSR